MGKTRQGNVPTLASWAEVDEALRLMGECENCIAELQAEHDRKEAELKAQSVAGMEPYREKIRLQEQLIREFVTANKAELDGQTKQLTHGKTGFRRARRCIVPAGAEAEMILALRRRDMLECIQVKENVNRDALKQYPDDVIEAVGASVQNTTRFWCEAAHADLAHP